VPFFPHRYIGTLTDVPTNLLVPDPELTIVAPLIVLQLGGCHIPQKPAVWPVA